MTDQFQTITEQHRAALDRAQEWADRVQPRVDELMAADPYLKPWTAMTIAQDELSIQTAHDRIAEGKPALDAVYLVGSYARFGAAVDLLPEAVLYKNIAELWRGSDPDDTDPRFLEVWRRAWQSRWRRESYIRDGKALPKNRNISIFRGQDTGAKHGIAWTTDYDIADKFAKGAATRQNDRPGSIYHALVPRQYVMAYITQRGESEVIVDPAFLLLIEEIGRYVIREDTSADTDHSQP